MTSVARVTVSRADRVLVGLKILTIFLGGMATIAVVFLADVFTARLANPVGVAGVEAVAMSEAEELHHWIGYKLGVAQIEDRDILHHVQKAMALATDAKQKSALDGILVEHLPAGHFIHTKNILKELLGTKAEPALQPGQLEARLALALLKENKMEDAQEQVEHMLATATIPAKEVVQQIKEAIQKGNLDAARQRLAELSGGQ